MPDLTGYSQVVLVVSWRIVRACALGALGVVPGLTQLVRSQLEDNVARANADSSRRAPATIKMMPAIYRELAVTANSKTEPTATRRMRERHQ